MNQAQTEGATHQTSHGCPREHVADGTPQPRSTDQLVDGCPPAVRSLVQNGPKANLVGLQRLLGNRQLTDVIQRQNETTPTVQRDQPPGPHPAPAPPYSPPPPPVPGSAEYEEQQARRKAEDARKRGEEVGAVWGTFEADVSHYLSLVNQAKPTPEERKKEVHKLLSKSEELPQPEELEDEALAKHYEAGFASAYGNSYASASMFIVAVNLGFELVKNRNLRVPSLKWGKWAGTVGNSKFLFNEAGIARFGLNKVPWVRFTNGKADFSAVAYMVQGKASIRVPGITGDRSNDYNQTVKILAQIRGESAAKVEAFLSKEGLRVHHYKNDLIQLVPENYHRCAHQGTVADLKAIAAAGGAAAGLYALLASFEEGQ